jgi:hypothetical protein
VRGQFSYTSYRPADGGSSGWQVKDRTGDLNDSTVEALIGMIGKLTDLGLGMPRFPDAKQIDAMPRRFSFAPFLDGVAMWHGTAAGTDGSGRQGNTFSQVAYSDQTNPTGGHRPIEYWRSPSWMTPWGAKQVRDDSDLTAAFPSAGGFITRRRVLDFLDDFDAPNNRLEVLPALADALVAARSSQRTLLLGVADQDEASLWIGAVTLFTSPAESFALGFSLLESPDTAVKASQRGATLICVTSADVEAAAAALSADASRPALAFDTSCDVVAGPLGQRHHVPGSTTSPAASFGQLISAVLLSGNRSNDLFSIIDATGEGPVRLGAALAQAITASADATADAKSVARRFLAQRCSALSNLPSPQRPASAVEPRADRQPTIPSLAISPPAPAAHPLQPLGTSPPTGTSCAPLARHTLRSGPELASGAVPSPTKVLPTADLTAGARPRRPDSDPSALIPTPPRPAAHIRHSNADPDLARLTTGGTRHRKIAAKEWVSRRKGKRKWWQVHNSAALAATELAVVIRLTPNTAEVEELTRTLLCGADWLDEMSLLAEQFEQRHVLDNSELGNLTSFRHRTSLEGVAALARGSQLAEDLAGLAAAYAELEPLAPDTAALSEELAQAGDLVFAWVVLASVSAGRLPDNVAAPRAVPLKALGRERTAQAVQLLRRLAPAGIMLLHVAGLPKSPFHDLPALCWAANLTGAFDDAQDRIFARLATQVSVGPEDVIDLAEVCGFPLGEAERNYIIHALR